jgi:hypothetical protein
MKIIYAISLTILALGLFACGSATEVGNPTGDVPTRTVVGVIDTNSLDMSAAQTLSVENALSPTEFSVVATAPGEDVVEAPVQEDSSFTIRVRVGRTYEWEVQLGGIKVGDFSFSQSSGPKSNRLRIENEGSDIDLGTVRYELGDFVPEREPIEQDDDGQQPGNGEAPQAESGGAASESNLILARDNEVRDSRWSRKSQHFKYLYHIDVFNLNTFPTLHT